ncbi:hypothetical protein C0J52_06736 [Blattella germanica]|nr:hypothetical protein C0J52_06736 [Blattella germanica]
MRATSVYSVSPVSWVGSGTCGRTYLVTVTANYHPERKDTTFQNEGCRDINTPSIGTYENRTTPPLPSTSGPGVYIQLKRISGDALPGFRGEKIRNIGIIEKMKVKGSLTEDIKTAQLRWFGHVKMMRDERLPNMIFEWQPMGRRKKGRPNLTLTEGMLKTMTERGDDGEE